MRYKCSLRTRPDSFLGLDRPLLAQARASSQVAFVVSNRLIYVIQAPGLASRTSHHTTILSRDHVTSWTPPSQPPLLLQPQQEMAPLSPPRHPLIILDGGTGHELKRRGISDGTFLSGLLANEKEKSMSIVERVHEDFLEAGCDVITTNSFVAVPQRMLEGGLALDATGAEARCAELIRAAVERARAAISRHHRKVDERGENTTPKRVAGCVSPLSECYFSEKVAESLTDLTTRYEFIISTLLDCKVDVLLAETLSTSREGVAILNALSKQTSDKDIPPLWMSFTIHDNRPTELRSGESLNDVCQIIIKEAQSLGLPLEAIGVNCSAPRAISDALSILAHYVEGTNIRCLCYGNCFQTTTSEWMDSLNNDTKGETNKGETNDKQKYASSDYDEDGYLLPVAYSRYAQKWNDEGGTIIGGCCGCSPAHMRAVAELKRCTYSGGDETHHCSNVDRLHGV